LQTPKKILASVLAGKMRTIDLVTGRTHGANDLGIEEIDPSSCGWCLSDCVSVSSTKSRSFATQKRKTHLHNPIISALIDQTFEYHDAAN
jgi:hypothetical protein